MMSTSRPAPTSTARRFRRRQRLPASRRKQHVDKVAGEVKAIWDLMNTTYDKFIRTTDPMHEKKVQKIFKKLHDQGDIYKGAYEGKYCKPCESFWTESQLKDGKLPGLRPPVRATPRRKHTSSV